MSEAMKSAWMEVVLAFAKNVSPQALQGWNQTQEQIGSDLTDSDVGSGQNFCGEGPLMRSSAGHDG